MLLSFLRLFAATQLRIQGSTNLRGILRWGEREEPAAELKQTASLDPTRQLQAHLGRRHLSRQQQRRRDHGFVGDQFSESR